jgi:hypothetical protein
MISANPVTSCWSAKERTSWLSVRRQHVTLGRMERERLVLSQRAVLPVRNELFFSIESSRIAAPIEAKVVVMAAIAKGRKTYRLLVI